MNGVTIRFKPMLILMFFCMTCSYARTWDAPMPGRVHNIGGNCVVVAAHPDDPNGGFLSIGDEDHNPIYVRFDKYGNKLWDSPDNGQFTPKIHKMASAHAMEDFGFFIGGLSFFTWRIDKNGMSMCTKQNGSGHYGYMDRLNDGTFVLVETNFNTLHRAEPDSGEEITDQQWPISANMKVYCITKTSDGGFLVAGEQQTTSNSLRIQKYHENGTLDTGFDTDGIYENSSIGEAYSIIEARDGYYYVTGIDNDPSELNQIYLLKLTGTGSPVAGWPKMYPDMKTKPVGVYVRNVSLCERNNSHFLLCGPAWYNDSTANPFILRVNRDGTIIKKDIISSYNLTCSS